MAENDRELKELKGNLDWVDSKGIMGWVQEQSNPEQPVSLIITDIDVLIGTVLANS
jgi:hypothetical protein